MRFFTLAALQLCVTASLMAETGYAAWLRYASIDDPAIRQQYDAMPASVVTLGDSPVLRAAESELVRGVRGMLARTLRVERRLPSDSAVVLGPFDAVAKAIPGVSLPKALPAESFWLKTLVLGGAPRLIVAGTDDRGVLYGTFALRRRMGLHLQISNLDEKQAPYAPVRWVNEWDNLDGSIERGYAGPSIFFENNNVRSDLGRVHDYARLLASLGINGCTINNVNANPRVITTEFLPQLVRVAEVFRPWGVRLSVSLDFSSPRSIGGLDTFDPLDQRVVEWWKNKVDEIYRLIPDFGGFVIKADSEGRLGPSAYGRTHADATNVVARPLKAYGGLLFYRGFVYDHKMDWRNLKNDRARAAYDNFKPLDGQFEDNALIQIKNGPIDFQVREPASPLFGALEKTSQAIELQITQEYLGQQRQLCYLVPMWKETLDFDLQAKGPGTPVKALVAGKVFNRPVGGFVGVSNVGLDTNWMGHHLAQANLHGFGRLAWNPDLSAREIAEEWTRLTFGHDKKVVDTIVAMQLGSWRTYETSTGPLGAQTLTDIVGPHYGPAVEASERNGWGQWHRADEKGIGMDRTVATGTGFIGQFRPPVAKIYESLRDCPDELLLWMHHVPYTYVLHSGKTVIQHIYDTHYQGVEEAGAFVREWKSLKGRVDEQRYNEVLARLDYQAGYAEVWRDAVCNWFLRTSGIPDSRGRAGHFPGRTEAEALKLEGYQVENVTPWEAASGSKAIRCAAPQCTAALRYDGETAWRDIVVQYFDLNNGVSRFRLRVAGQLIDEWTAADSFPTRRIDAHSSTRRTVTGVRLKPGDEILIEGIPDGGEGAPLDYIEIRPNQR